MRVCLRMHLAPRAIAIARQCLKALLVIVAVDHRPTPTSFDVVALHYCLPASCSPANHRHGLPTARPASAGLSSAAAVQQQQHAEPSDDAATAARTRPRPALRRDGHGRNAWDGRWAANWTCSHDARTPWTASYAWRCPAAPTAAAAPAATADGPSLQRGRRRG